MKKTILLSATAILACVACNKEITEPAAPAETIITAYTPGSETRAAVDGLQVQWTTGDQVALFNTDGTPKTFTLVGDGPVSSGIFSSSESGINPSGLAAFPAAGASVSGKKISINVPATIPYGTSPIPMVGKATSLTSFSFALTTGAICIRINDVPPYPCSFVLSADENITGTLVIPDYQAPTTGVAFASDGAGKTITVTDVPKGNAEFVLPLPAGTYNNIDVKLVAADGTTIVPGSHKTMSNPLTITAGGIAKMSSIELEKYQSPAPWSKTADGAAFDQSKLPGKWNVLGNNSTKDGVFVLGGGGADPKLVCPYDKTWDWDSSIYRISDNGLTVKVTGMAGYVISGTMNWWNGADGQWWNYIWKFQNSEKPEYIPFYGTDLSGYYKKMPRGEKAFTLDLSSMTATLDNGEKPKVLMPGTYTFLSGDYKQNLLVPDGCFALMFHLGNMKGSTTWYGKDIDRFMFCPLEYIIIFERTGDL